MGSKTLAKRDFKCERCSLKFQTTQALRSHQNTKHPEIVKNPELSPARPKATPKNTSAATPTARVSQRLQMRKGGDVDTEENEKCGDRTIEMQNSIGFVCPKCPKNFPTYFQAFKHVQKKHCVDKLGNPVLPDSPDIIKPVHIEKCSVCKQLVDSTHKCGSVVVNHDKINTFICLGCDEEFLSIVTFNKHVPSVHGDIVDSMFFKSSEEFEIWKKNMENQVRIKYLTLNKYPSQKYYTCNYGSPNNEFNMTYLCPSLIITKEISNGIQIHYYKVHCGHTCPEYELPEKFSHYLTSKKGLKSAFDLLIEKDDEDLYLKFEKLMGNIINDAAKVSISHLKTLFDSALNMQSYLNSYDEDQDDKGELPLISKSMNDDQITQALENKRTSARLKRKSETRASVDTKKAKVDKPDSDDKHSGPKSKKEDSKNDASKSKKEDCKTTSKENKAFESPRIRARPSSTLLSPSFNDTYKQFIGTNEPSQDTTKNIKNTKPKEILKTKIGQYSPKVKSPHVEEKVVKTVTVEKKNSKPNILKPLKTNTKLSFGKDIKYEVREQENDCNILILKI